MPTVPQIDPQTAQMLQAASGGQFNPEPQHMLMAAMDMHDRGQLIQPQDQSSFRTGKPAKLLPTRGHRRR
jgi:hypothetical protein